MAGAPTERVCRKAGETVTEMATWQMRASFTRYKVITAGPTFSLRARLSRHYLPLRSEGGPASFLTHFKDRRPYTERVCKDPGPCEGGAAWDAALGSTTTYCSKQLSE